jgi:hypothetical protein
MSLDLNERNTRLPLWCYSADENEIIRIRRNQSGYDTLTPQAWDNPHNMPADELADFLNAKLGVTRPQRLAMECGSMFGWQAPGCNPALYNRQMNH